MTQSKKKTSSRGVGDPPEGMKPEEIEIWHELKALPWHNRPGRLDRRAFALLVRLLALDQAGKIEATQDATLLELLRDFGLTPGSRFPKVA